MRNHGNSNNKTAGDIKLYISKSLESRINRLSFTTKHVRVISKLLYSVLKGGKWRTDFLTEILMLNFLF